MKQKNIYDYGFTRSLNKELPDKSTGVVYDTANALNTGSILSGGNLNLKTLTIGGLTRQVAPGDDIQGALNAVNREGGGVVQLLAKTYILTSSLSIPANVHLQGTGIDLTILDFTSAVLGITLIGTSTDIKNNVKISDLTIQNSNSTAGLDIQYADFFKVENVKVTSCDQKGIRINNARDFILFNCTSSSNTGNGIEINGDDNRSTTRFTLINCVASSNGAIGFSFNAGSNDLQFITLVACRATSNTGDGFDFAATGSSALRGSLLGCASGSNVIGFDTDSNCQDLKFTGCQASSNSSDDFQLNSTITDVVGCFATDEFNLQSNFNGTLIGNTVNGGSTVDPTTTYTIPENEVYVWFNKQSNTRTTRDVKIMKNNSGAGLRAGNLVVIGSVASGDNITTTTTNGDNKVFGMADETITSGNWGRILTQGYTTQLYATNAETSLAIGDWLSAHSHAYYAKKAITGQMAFAICLEAPTTGTAIIDALLVSPRLL